MDLVNFMKTSLPKLHACHNILGVKVPTATHYSNILNIVIFMQ